MKIEVRSFSLNLNKARGNQVPFEVIDIYKKKDWPHVSHMYPACFTLEPTEHLMGYLNDFINLGISKKTIYGFTRHDKEKSVCSSIGEHKVTQDDLLVIPALITSAGGKLRPKYMVHKKARFALAYAKSTNKEKENTKTHSKNLINLNLQIGGKTGTPCSMCPRGMSRYLNPDYCQLGEQKCLSNILLGRSVNGGI